MNAVNLTLKNFILLSLLEFFYSHDPDPDPMTLIYKHDLGILKTNWHTKKECSRSKYIQNLERKQDTQTWFFAPVTLILNSRP